MPLMSNVGHQQNSRVLGHRWHQAVPFAGLHLSCAVCWVAPECLAGRAPSRRPGCAAAFRAYVLRPWPCFVLGVRGAVVARLVLGAPVVACLGLARYSVLIQLLSGSAPWLLPNPSINRTCPGKPGHASYLKR
jgi:hypothetical protein